MKRAPGVIVLFVVSVVALAACNTGSSTTQETAADLLTGRDEAYSLARFVSPSAMERYLKESIKENTCGANSNCPAGGVAIAEGAPGADAGAAAPPTDDFSTTTLQEAGVDEADLIKTDGRYLYTAYPGGLYYGVADGVGAPEPAGPEPVPALNGAVNDEFTNVVRVFELSPGAPAATAIAAIRLPAPNSFIDSLYLVTGRENGAPDILVVLSSGMGAPPGWYEPWYWVNGRTDVTVFNVDDPAQPSRIAHISVDGFSVGTRRIGETLYLVTRYTPMIVGYTPYPVTPQEEEANGQSLDSATLSDLLPDLRVDGETVGDLPDPQNCYVPPTPDERFSTPDIITVAAIDLRSPGSLGASCVIGGTEAMYVSPRSMYLATTRYDYVISPAIGVTEVDAVYPGPEVTTDLHKFTLAASPPAYAGSATVPGHLGWEQDKKSFRMGERNGYLRIVTSIGETWDNSATTRLTILREPPGSPGGTLDEVAHLPNGQRPERIGKPGERLYATRFLGDRGYLVTFRVTDPLYVLDLSNPADPYIAGALEIAGYSDYLHPIGDTLLLGIGKDAVPDTTGFGDGRGAWYQGVKVSLFDISDLSNPREVNSLVIGKRGTDSDALLDHHAVTYLPPGDHRPARLALPVYLHDTTPQYRRFNPNDPTAFYEWTNTGLYLFDITGETGVEFKGKITSASRSATQQYDGNSGTNRAMIQGDTVHFLYQGRVWSSGWGADSATGPQ